MTKRRERRKTRRAAPPRTDQKERRRREIERVGQPREGRRTEGDGGTPPKRTEDETIQSGINLGTERNRDNAAKRETPQGEERTGNPSSRKDKKPRNSSRPKQVGDRLIGRPEEQERKPGTYRGPGKHVPRNRHKRQAARRGGGGCTQEEH